MLNVFGIMFLCKIKDSKRVMLYLDELSVVYVWYMITVSSINGSKAQLTC